MNETTPLDDLKHEVAISGKDGRTRTLLLVLLVLWLLTLGTLVAVGWNAYFDQKDKAQTLAQQLQIACERGTIGPPDFTAEDAQRLCSNAEKSSPDQVTIEGPPGPQGPPGIDGTDGTDGTDGRAGRNGKDGDPGSNGSDGAPGEDGESIPGETGATGPAGPPGPQGEQGPPGADGTNGTNGADAVPFTFSFTIDQGPFSQTYICNITQANANVVCQEQE